MNQLAYTDRKIFMKSLLLSRRETKRMNWLGRRFIHMGKFLKSKEEGKKFIKMRHGRVDPEEDIGGEDQKVDVAK